MKKKIVNYFAQLTTFILVLGFSAWGIWYAYRIYYYDETNNAQVELYITPISCRVMGYVKSVNCVENQIVNKGDTLLVIDDDEYRITYQKNEALLNRAMAELRMAQKQIDMNEVEETQCKSEISIAKIKLENNKKEFQRVKNLLSKQSITQQQYDQIEVNYLLAKKELEIANSKYDKSLLHREELIGNEQVEAAKVNNCKGDLANSKLQLEYTVITAPYNGRIGKIEIQKGQLLQAGHVISFISNESAGKWIVANVKETQLENYGIGKKVSITIDAIPNRKFNGIIQSVSPATGTRYSMMPPNNATGNFVRITQRVPVRIKLLDADDVENKLRGGMNAYVSSPKL